VNKENDNHIDQMLYNSKSLGLLNIRELRDMGRKFGVPSPTTLKKDKLIEYILKIVYGEVATPSRSNYGRPSTRDFDMPKYIEKIKKLIPFSQINDFSNALDEIEIYKSLLKFAYDKRGIVSIELNSSGFSDVVGFVEDINKDVCSINQIDEYGFDDGHSYIKIDDITEISYSRIKEKRLIRLWNFNKNTGDGSSC